MEQHHKHLETTSRVRHEMMLCSVDKILNTIRSLTTSQWRDLGSGERNKETRTTLYLFDILEGNIVKDESCNSKFAANMSGGNSLSDRKRHSQGHGSGLDKNMLSII